MTCPRCEYVSLLKGAYEPDEILLGRTPHHDSACPARLRSGDQGSCGTGNRNYPDRYATELLRGVSL